jgi:4-amino-4-deoxy-L-arabinose transferase-like glycosyltransferase
LLVGLAVLGKLTAAGLLAPLAFAILWPASKRLWGQRLGHLAGAGLGAAVVVSPWLLLNKLLLGDFTQQAAGAAFQANIYTPISVDAGYFVAEMIGVFASFWTAIPSAPSAAGLALLGVVVVLGMLSLVGLVRLVREPGSLFRRGVLICWVAVAAQLVVTLAASGSIHAGVTSGRYLYPALAAILCLLAIGLWREMHAIWPRSIAFGAYAAAALALLASYAVGIGA